MIRKRLEASPLLVRRSRSAEDTGRPFQRRVGRARLRLPESQTERRVDPPELLDDRVAQRLAIAGEIDAGDPGVVRSAASLTNPHVVG